MVRRYCDAYGRRAIAIGCEDKGWKLTFLNGPYSYTKRCRSEARVRTILKVYGKTWTEVG